MSINISIDIEADEIISGADRWSKRELLKYLLKGMSNNDINEIVNNLNNDNIKKEFAMYTSPGGTRTILEGMFQAKLLHLSKSYMCLDKADMDIIETIARKY